jgi:hypothetical protein
MIHDGGHSESDAEAAATQKEEEAEEEHIDHIDIETDNKVKTSNGNRGLK